MNPRPSGYEPDELPDCSTPRYKIVITDLFCDPFVLEQKMGEEGFEPPKSSTTDLQSAPFGHLGIPPDNIFKPIFGLEPKTC